MCSSATHTPDVAPEGAEAPATADAASKEAEEPATAGISFEMGEDNIEGILDGRSGIESLLCVLFILGAVEVGLFDCVFKGDRFFEVREFATTVANDIPGLTTTV